MIKDDGIVKAKLDFGVDYYKGEKGDDGFSPSITTTEIDNGYTLTITNKDGEESIDILNGSGDSEEVWESISELEQRVNEIPINTFDLSDRIAKGTGDKSVRIGDISNDRDSGKYSVSQGYNSWAYGSYAHAEGNSSIAAGSQAHAEGNQTHAQGMNSHAEGISTYAYDNAHAEGMRTIARAQQHAEGKYNIDMDNRNIQAVVGNGTADNIRSTMFVRDWDGNEYLAGQMYVECDLNNGNLDEQFSGNQVATVNYVDQAIADIPSSSGSEYTADVDDLFITSIYSQLGLDDTEFVGSIAPLPITATADEFIEMSKKGVWFNNTYGNGFTGSNFSKLKSELDITNIRQININSSGVALSTNNFQYNYPTNSLNYKFYKVGNAGIFVMITNIQDIKKLGELIKNNIPVVPTTDGNYKLTTTISSGTATTEWTEDSGSSGSSYTFTNGLTNSNGTVSWDLNDRIAKGTAQRGAVAVGYDTTASGDCSFAEGYGSIASSGSAHAEGEFTQARGAHSHAEGNRTIARGVASHAEGNNTMAEGRSAHAEGNDTVAQSNEQHAEGMFNIRDYNQIFQNIVGNGTADNARSNSFARDWNGNEYLAGKLYVNCSDYTTDANGLVNENANGSEVATKDYVDGQVQDCYNDWQLTTEDLQNQVDEIKNSGGSSSGESYTAGSGINIDSNNVISANANPLIFSMLQMTTAGNNMPIAVKLNNGSTWEEFVSYIIAGKVVYINSATSYTFNNNYKLTPELLGVSNLYAINLADMSPAMMSSNVASYPATGTQVYYSTYYYFDGAFLWSWKKPEDIGNFIKVKYRNSQNVGLGYALQQITTDIDTKLTVPTPPSTDGNYILTCAVNNGSITYTWVDATIGGTY